MTTTRLVCGALLAMLLGAPVCAERMQRLGSYEAHYSLVPTTMLSADVAASYQITRGRDRALLNVTVLDAAAMPVQAQVSGTMRDLLGKPSTIPFREVLEGDAVYYLAEIRHDDRQVLRFAIDVRTPDGRTHELTFQQTMYWSDR